MSKRASILCALGMAGALAVPGAAHGGALQYTGNFCGPMFGANNYTKGTTFQPYSSFMDIVCPIATDSTNLFNTTRLRVRTSSTGGGSCTWYTRTAYGSQVAAVTKSLTNTPNTDQTISFGSISFSNAQYAYITCYLPPGTAIYNYFGNQPD